MVMFINLFISLIDTPKLNQVVIKVAMISYLSTTTLLMSSTQFGIPSSIRTIRAPRDLSPATPGLNSKPQPMISSKDLR
jgi:hypothetical protein